MRADVAVVGSSFAGLGVAYYLRDSGLDVLLIDPKEIGHRRLSTCGVPKPLADSLAPSSVCYSTRYASIETPRIKQVLEFSGEYCTVDYREFCAALFKRSNARSLKAEARSGSTGTVSTSEGDVEAEFVVDCSGWRRVLSKGAPKPDLFTGIETTIPIGSEHEGRLNFFVDKRIVNGYGWIFPVGKGIGRVGLGGYTNGAPLNRAYMAFLDKLGLNFQKNELTGGAIPSTGMRKPVDRGIFFVGDSAGQVLPLSSEGIRTTLYFSEMCARAIKAVSSKEMSRKSGESFYEKRVNESNMAFRTLKLVQDAALALPEPFFDTLLSVGGSRLLKERIVRGYERIATDSR